MSDRRGMSGGAKAGIGGGIIGVVVLAIVTLLGGGDLGDVINNVLGQGGVSIQNQEGYTPDAEDERLADLASKVLAGTEDVLAEEFRRQGWG